MATRTLRAVGHEDRLSLIEHLDELRGRLIFSVIAIGVSFAFCFWQNHAILNLINRPLDKTQSLNSNAKTNDPLQQASRFQLRLGAAMKATAPALRATRKSIEELSTSDKLSAADRRALVGPIAQLGVAVNKIQIAANAVPTNTKRRPITLSPTEPFTTTISVSLYAAILLVLPLLLYQLYAFILPAFTDAERKVALPLMLLAPFLFIAGVAFAYFVVMPRSIQFLTNFNSSNFNILLQAKTYYSFALVLLGGIGLLFEIPVAVLAVTRIGGVTTKQLRAARGYVILAISILAAVATPTPDPLTMTIAMAPLVLLYELSILLAAWANRLSPKVEEEEEEEVEEEEVPSFFGEGDHVPVPDPNAPQTPEEDNPDAL
jgi:sec-independent protein translocase protein TatC